MALDVLVARDPDKVVEKEHLNSIVVKVRNIQHIIDDLVCTVYPPQDREQLLSNASKLLENISIVLDFCMTGTKVLESTKVNLKKLNTITTTLAGQAMQELEEICKN